MTKTAADLRKHLQLQTYDKTYQDIEILNFVGYDPSYLTWNNIQSLNINWVGKTVCDLGCFHGYFTLKVSESGANCVGLDRHEPVLTTARMIAELSYDWVIKFKVWVGGEPTPKCDIALVLNMLHHCDDQVLTLQNINCKYAIFEVNPDQVERIQEQFEILQNLEGRQYPQRPSRRLLYAKKIQ